MSKWPEEKLYPFINYRMIAGFWAVNQKIPAVKLIHLKKRQLDGLQGAYRAVLVAAITQWVSLLLARIHWKTNY